MRDYVLIANLVFGALVLTEFSGAPLTSAAAHEAHKTTCNETAANAMKADIQSMPDGDAKTTAMKEMEMAEEMMGKKDMKACEDHMHSAMEAMEQ
jgi:hypothetical protein